MAALLVAIGVMGIMLTVAMPAWKTAAQREREAELIFRGEQYARALMLFQRRVANAAPPSIDFLVEERFLRKKYKDPITDDDFALVVAGQNARPGAGGNSGATPDGGRGAAPAPSQPFGGTAGTPVGGGIAGVVSKSTAQSLRLYNGRDHYNEWVFTPTEQTQAPGVPGAAQPGVVPGAPLGGGPGRGRSGGDRTGPGGRSGPRQGGLPQIPFEPPQG